MTSSTRPRNSRLVIAVLPDESAAFQAYRLLQSHGISPEHMALVGKGYSTPESVGLLDPRRTAWKYARLGIGVFGLAGACLGMGLHVFAGLVVPRLPWLHSLIVVTAVFSACGSTFGSVAGMLYGLLYKSSTSIACRNCLRQGHYLLMLEGPEAIAKKGRDLLHQYSDR